VKGEETAVGKEGLCKNFPRQPTYGIAIKYANAIKYELLELALSVG
jgi:hypothetical protein